MTALGAASFRGTDRPPAERRGAAPARIAVPPDAEEPDAEEPEPPVAEAPEPPVAENAEPEEPEPPVAENAEPEEPEPPVAENAEPEAAYQTAAGGEWVTGTLEEACASVYKGGGVLVLRDIELETGITVTKSMAITSADPDNPCTITYSPENRGDYLLTVSLPAYTVVFLQDIILDGGREDGFTTHAELVGMNSHPYGELVLRKGAVLQNNDNVDTAESGGGLRVMSGKAYMETDSVIQNCRGKAGGGAAVVTQYSALYLQGGTIRDCEAFLGGGICINEKGWLFMLAGSSVCNNLAKARADGTKGHGGGIYAENGFLQLAGGTVKENSAQYGGGMYFESGRAQVAHLSVTENHAEFYAGGILCTPKAALGIGATNAKPLIRVTGNTCGDGYFDNMYLDGSTGDAPSMPGEMATQPMALINTMGDTAAINISRWVRPDTDNPYRIVAIPGQISQTRRYTITVEDVAKFHSDDPKYVTMLLDDPGSPDNGTIVITIADVVFDNENHGPAVPGQRLEDDHKVTEPDAEQMVERGYTFQGWYEDEAHQLPWDFATEVAATDGQAKPLKILHAKWDLNVYNIIYDLGGGVNDEDNPATYTVESPDITLQPPAREGYRFLGWKLVEVVEGEVLDRTPASRSADVNSGIPTGSIGKRTFQAQWEELPTYTVTYTDGADGTAFADQENKNLPEGTTTPAFSGTPTREGYTFQGWLPEVAEFVTGNAIYTAQWEKNAAPNPPNPPGPGGGGGDEGGDPPVQPPPDPGTDPLPDPDIDPLPDPGGDPPPGFGTEPAPGSGAQPSPEPGTEPAPGSGEEAPPEIGSEPASEPEPAPGPTPKPDPVPKTGDPTHTTLWAGCALASLAGILLVLRPRRRRR